MGFRYRIFEFIRRDAHIGDNAMQGLCLDVAVSVDGNNDTRFVGDSIKNSVAPFLAIQIKAKPLCNTDQVIGLDLGMKWTHPATWMGLMMTSSLGMGSARAFRLSM